MFESRTGVMVPVEPGPLLRRRFVVGLVVAGALSASAVRRGATHNDHAVLTWSDAVATCTPETVDAVTDELVGNYSRLLCEAAAGQLDYVRDQLAFLYQASGLRYELARAVHAASHRGDPRAEAVLEMLDDSVETRLHRAIVLYRAGHDRDAVAAFEDVRTSCSGGACLQATRALREIAAHVPLERRTVQCTERLAELEEQGAVWQSCQRHGACGSHTASHPWLRIATACGAGGSDDPLLCLAASAPDELPSLLSQASADEQQHLVQMLEPFAATPRARAALDAAAATDRLAPYVAAELARIEQRAGDKARARAALSHVDLSLAEHTTDEGCKNAVARAWAELEGR